jgi:hypothetical protein
LPILNGHYQRGNGSRLRSIPSPHPLRHRRDLRPAADARTAALGSREPEGFRVRELAPKMARHGCALDEEAVAEARMLYAYSI